MLPAPGGARQKGVLGSGYAKGPDGKWAWSRPLPPGEKPANSLTRSPSENSIALLASHTAYSSKHPAKDGKVVHASTSRNVVGEEFKSAGKDNGLEIWRIEAMKAKPIPKEQHGKFYSGDSYIVLNTSLKTSSFHIHYWIGKDSSQDKYATAAYKTVELDNHFTGGAIQHRETQGSESDIFKAYFPDGITYLEGGVASSFRHVKREEFTTRLLRLKGKRDVRVKQVEVSYKSLNKGDSFVLDTGRLLFQWNGPSANRAERVKGVEVIRAIKDNERGGRVTIISIDYHDDVKLNDTKKLNQFWEALGSKGEIAPAETAGDDVEYEKIADTEVHLRRIRVVQKKTEDEFENVETASVIEVDEITERPLKKEMLDSHNCYVIESDTDVFCWIGKSTNLQQKTEAYRKAQYYHRNKPTWVPLLRIVQGAETPLLKEKFVNWRALLPKNLDYSSADSYLPRAGSKERIQQEDIDVSQLLEPITGVPQPDKGFLHDGTGTLKVWRIDEFKRVEVPEAAHGVFFEEECYLCMYMEIKDKKRSHYIYFWQGRHSPMEFRGASALMAKEMADTVRGKCLQYRIVQGKEPEHFLMLFKPKKSAVIGGNVQTQNKVRECVYPMVIGQGLHRGREGYTGLYHVKQTYMDEAFEWNTKAVQVSAVVSRLNSNDAFVLFGKDGKCFVWCGTGCSPAERRVARAAAVRLVGDANIGRILVIEESKEPAYFWTYLEGGEDVEKVRSLYPSANYLKRPSLAIRLFSCSNTTGTFRVIEIPNFSQEDLDNDDVFMLDCWAEVFLWVGAGANETEKRLAMQTALAYVTQGVEKVNRPVDTPIYYVQAGEEPPQFTCHFLAWDSALLAPSQNPEITDHIVTKPKPLLSSRSSSNLNTPKATSPRHISPLATSPRPVSPRTTSPRSTSPRSYSYPVPTSSASTPASTPKTAPTAPFGSAPSAPAAPAAGTAAPSPSVVKRFSYPVAAAKDPETKSEVTTTTTTASSSENKLKFGAAATVSVPTTPSAAPVPAAAFAPAPATSAPAASAPAKEDVKEAAPEMKAAPQASDKEVELAAEAPQSRSELLSTESAPKDPAVVVATIYQDASSAAGLAIQEVAHQFAIDSSETRVTHDDSAPSRAPEAVEVVVAASTHDSPPSAVDTEPQSISVTVVTVTEQAPALIVSEQPPASTATSSQPTSTKPNLSIKVPLAGINQAESSSSSISAEPPKKVVLTRKDGSVLKVEATQPKKFTVFAKRAGTIPVPTKEPEKPKVVKVELVSAELEKYNKQFYTFEELTAKKKPPGVDVTTLEKYLPDDEFQKRFEMTKDAFYALPNWKRITLRKKMQLY